LEKIMDYLTNLSTERGAIAIRQAQPEDAVPLRLLRMEALLDTPQAFGMDHQTVADQTAEEWKDRLIETSKKEIEVIFIAEADAELVGMTGLVRGRSSKTRHGGMIWGVYVNPAWRGLRIAEALIAGCLDWGAANGVRVAHLGVITTNAAAIQCYLRCGFSVYGVEPMSIHWNGRDNDELLMVRKLII
jgi:RimJ/RimL family protein N-acetyltransferase